MKPQTALAARRARHPRPLPATRRAHRLARSRVPAACLAVLTPMIAATAPAAAQPPAPAEPTEQREAIARLGFLEGEWSGEGWMSFGPQYRSSFTSREIVERDLGGTVLVVRGMHDAEIPGSEGPVRVHDAMAVVSWDPEADRYRFDTWTARGTGTAGHGELLGEQRFRWYPGTDTVRFTIEIDDQGRWRETGERRGDDGVWREFFGMTVSKNG